MSRLLLTLGLAARFGLTGSSVAAQTVGTFLSVSPPGVAVAPGHRFELDIMITSDTPTRGVQFALTYDPKLVEIDHVDAGEFYSDWASAHSGQAGVVVPFSSSGAEGRTSIGALAVLANAEGGAQGSGRLARVTLNAREATGEATLEFSDVRVSSDRAQSLPVVQGTGATISVGGAGPPAAPQPVQFRSITPTPAADEPIGVVLPDAPVAPSSPGLPAWVLISAVPLIVGLLTYVILYCAGFALERLRARWRSAKR
jgi:hypothetical protein